MTDALQNQEKWVIRATPRELFQVYMALSSSHRAIGLEGVAWLTRTPSKRLWIIRERATTAWFVADCDTDDPYFALPVTLDFLDKLTSLAARTGGAVDITCDMTDGSMVARSGDHYVSVDHPEGLEFTEEDMPFIPSEGGDRSLTAEAVVSMDDAQMFGSLLFENAKSTDGAMPPFVQMEIKYDSVRWTVDWRGFGSGRSSGRVPARTKGTAALEFFPYALGDVLLTLDREETDFVRFFVDSDRPDYLYVVGPHWGTRTVLDDEHLARWTSKVKKALGAADIEIEEIDGPRLPPGFVAEHQGTNFYVSIERHIDEPGEYLLLKHVACTDIPSSPELLAEINSLNSVTYGASVYWSDDEVVVESCIPMKSLDTFEEHFGFFRTAMSFTTGLDSFLPLFLSAKGGDEHEESGE